MGVFGSFASIAGVRIRALGLCARGRATRRNGRAARSRPDARYRAALAPMGMMP